MNTSLEMEEFHHRFVRDCTVSNWDGYDAKPLSGRNLDRLKYCIKLVFYYQKVIGEDWPEPFIAPSASGSFQFEWDVGPSYELNNQHRFEHHLEIEIFDTETFMAESLEDHHGENAKTLKISGPIRFLEIIKQFMDLHNLGAYEEKDDS